VVKREIKILIYIVNKESKMIIIIDNIYGLIALIALLAVSAPSKIKALLDITNIKPVLKLILKHLLELL